MKKLTYGQMRRIYQRAKFDSIRAGLKQSLRRKATKKVTKNAA